MKRLSTTLLAALAMAASAFAQAPPNTTQTQIKKFRFVQPALQKGGEVKWQVAPQGHVEFQKDEYVILENDVRVDYQDVKLRADKVTINLKTKDAVAEGHVIVDQGPTRVTADHAVFNLDSKTGTFFKATASMEPTMYFVGDKIEKTGDTTYHLTNGVFTSCDLDRPAWSFHLAEADVTLDDYAHMKDVSFRARDLPIIWLPRFVYPTKKDRSQGFLIPRVLFSTGYEVRAGQQHQLGQRLELGYFVPIGDSADITGYADLNTKGYNGVGVDVRYVPSPNVKIGELSAYTVRDPLLGKEQWRYQYRHYQEKLFGGFRGVVDVQDYSDLDFFRTYDRDPRLHMLSNIYSSAYLTKNTATYSLNFLTDRRDIILGHVVPDDLSSPQLKQRFEQLPSLQFRMYPQRVMNLPLYFSMESSASHLLTSGTVNAYGSGNTPQNANYYRGDIFPTLSLQLRTPAWLSIKPQISARETHYSASLDPTDPTNPYSPMNLVDQPLNRFYAQGQVDVVGPSFSRVFNEQIGGFTKFKHVIEPRLRYIYTTNINDQSRVIRFDTVDSPFLPIVEDSVEYSLTQRIIGKEAGPNASPREVLSFSIRQTVSLSKPFTSGTGGNLAGSSIPIDTNQKFTPLVASLHMNPYQSITFDASSTWGNVSHQIDQASLSANLIGGGANDARYLGFTWFANFNQPGTTNTDSSQIRINTGSNLFHDRFRADVSLNWDAKLREFLEQRYLVGVNASCWGLALEFRRYLTFDQSKSAISYGLAVSLKNIGTIGTH